MICQILINLLSNAVKFTPPGGRIVLSGAAHRRRRAPRRGSPTPARHGGARDQDALTPFGQIECAEPPPRRHRLGLPLARR